MRGCISVAGYYLLLVLLPQTLWILLSSRGDLLALCCGDSLVSQLLQTEGNISSTPATSSPGRCYADSRPDSVTARLCSCDITGRNSTDDSKELDLSFLSEDDGLGGWGVSHCLPDLSGPCTIKKRDSSLTLRQFLTEFAFSEPVILTGMSSQEAFKAQSTKYKLLKEYGHDVITVATANTHSYRKVQMTLCDYVEKVMKPQTYQGLGNETLYLFGDNDRERWKELFSLYQLPPLQLPGKEPVLSFGMAGPGTGVPFHVHGPTYAETIYGRKRWFLYPPDHSPFFNPDETTLRWVANTYPSFQDHERPLECTLNPGEILYLPNMWWHATLNVDPVVFMSTFYS